MFQREDKCDKDDYIVAAACGVIGGLIDIIFVGEAGNGDLDKWSDKQTDKVVKKFAEFTGWDGKNDSVASAIGHLEREFKVNYDQRYTSDVGGKFKMSTKNHHMKSLGHAPDLYGLIYSLRSQFTGYSYFIADGEKIKVPCDLADKFELRGNNIIEKLYYGCVNWIGHLMSDIAGSSGSKGNSGRGTGIVAPFYELFGYCKFGEFQVGKDRQDLATIATRAFQEGYDFRHCVAGSIPLLVTELLIKFIWSLRRRFQYEYPVNECIPTKDHANLRVMVLIGDGVLCVLDIADAALRSDENFLKFFMRLNLVAWLRLVRLSLKEVSIRLGFDREQQKNISAYARIDDATRDSLYKLKKSNQVFYISQKEKTDKFITLTDEAEDESALKELVFKIVD